tara:strand:+ start:230 stop:628 length:399 start_codon:yes stop_codon:yes gene_type:complete
MNSIKDILRNSSLRPTKQRIMIGMLLFNDTDKHVTAESLYRELKVSKQKISLATVYNTLHDFCEKKLLKKVNVDAEKVYFDTNTNPHHHFYSESEKLLIDISKDKIKIHGLPKAPKGKKIKDVELIAHLTDS